MKLRKQKGQSTLEYIILVGAVVALLIVFMGTEDSVFRQTISDTLDDTTGTVETAGARLTAGLLADIPEVNADD